MPFEQIRSVTVCVSGGPGRPFNSSSDLFEESDDILAHVRQTDNDVVVVDVAERGVVSALPPGLLQDQIPAVHSGHEVLVLSERAEGRKWEQDAGCYSLPYRLSSKQTDSLRD